MYYTYVLQSRKDGKFYVGHTKDLNQRFDHHNETPHRKRTGYLVIV